MNGPGGDNVKWSRSGQPDRRQYRSLEYNGPMSGLRESAPETRRSPHESGLGAMTGDVKKH